MKITHISGFKFDVESRGHHIITDQPRPVGGDEGMMPTEFLGASLGGCVAVYAIEYLMRHDLPTEGFSVDVVWQGAQRPNRIGAFQVTVNVPVALSEKHRATLERTCKACTVHHTLEHPPETTILLNAPQ